MRLLLFSIVALPAALCGSAMAGTVFYDSFETGMQNWTPWVDVLCHPGPPPPTHYGCDYFGPNPLFQSDNHPRTGTRCARQEQAQPWWYGSMRVMTGLPNDRTIRLSVWQFEDFNKQAPFPTWVAHDQVQGWIALTGDGDTPEEEFLAIGVHAHKASPAPTLNWWQHLSWSTSVEGWNVTTVARAQGFRHLEIVVHPYTGAVGDVEFLVNGTVVALASRKATAAYPNGIPINKIGLGSSAAHIAEDYITNTYEFFWYDDVSLSAGVAADFDNDGDVDLADFSAFSNCFNGPNSPPASADCRGPDLDGDGDVDLGDFSLFQDCFNGPNAVPACP